MTEQSPSTDNRSQKLAGVIQDAMQDQQHLFLLTRYADPANITARMMAGDVIKEYQKHQTDALGIRYTAQEFVKFLDATFQVSTYLPDSLEATARERLMVLGVVLQNYILLPENASLTTAIQEELSHPNIHGLQQHYDSLVELVRKEHQ